MTRLAEKHHEACSAKIARGRTLARSITTDWKTRFLKQTEFHFHGTVVTRPLLRYVLLKLRARKEVKKKINRDSLIVTQTHT